MPKDLREAVILFNSLDREVTEKYRELYNDSLHDNPQRLSSVPKVNAESLYDDRTTRGELSVLGKYHVKRVGEELRSGDGTEYSPEMFFDSINSEDWTRIDKLALQKASMRLDPGKFASMDEAMECIKAYNINLRRLEKLSQALGLPRHEDKCFSRIGIVMHEGKLTTLGGEEKEAEALNNFFDIFDKQVDQEAILLKTQELTDENVKLERKISEAQKANKIGVQESEGEPSSYMNSTRASSFDKDLDRGVI